MSTAASITVEFSTSLNLDNPTDKTYRLDAAATAEGAGDPAVFVFETLPPLPGVTEAAAQFVTVATTAYMEELPDDPEAAVSSPYMYRSPQVSLYFRTEDEIASAISSLRRRLQDLARTTTLMTEVALVSTETYNFLVPDIEDV
jgi:hypothetical protein